MSSTGWLVADLYLTFAFVFVAVCALKARARGRNPVVWGSIGLCANIVRFVVLVALPVRPTSASSFGPNDGWPIS